MPTDVLFIHSAGLQTGDQGSAPLVKHLRQALGPGFTLHAPPMPMPEQPSYVRWHGAIEELLATTPSPRLLVGHSLGGSVLLKYLSEHALRHAPAGLFIVAAPFWGLGGWDADEFRLRAEFASSLPEAMPVRLYQARDDEVVDIAHLSHYAEAIPQAHAQALVRGGHTFPQGLPELARDIESLARSMPGA